jgi:excisionase family DNA binding protein
MTRYKREQVESAYYTVAGAAQHYNVSERTIRRLIERGELNAMRMASAIRIPKNQPRTPPPPRPVRRGRPAKAPREELALSD